MIVDSSAIVFKVIPFRESSLVVTLLTDKHGKIAVMARGAKRNRNKYGGLLQPGSLLDVTYYYKPTRDIQNLSNAIQKKATWRIQEVIEKMALGLVTLELSEQLCHENEPIPELFTFLSDFLPWLHQTDTNPKYLFPYIQYRLAGLIGIGISMDDGFISIENNQDQNLTISFPDDREDKASKPTSQKRDNVISGRDDHKWYLNIASGCFSSKVDTGPSFVLSPGQLEYMRLIITGKQSKLLTESFSSRDIKNLISYFDRYFQYHVEGIKSRKSDAVFDQIL